MAATGDSEQPSESLESYLNSRDIIRLLQCNWCSRPLRLPVRLPCGNTICRRCLPETHKRENITYPQLKGRDRGFYCPFADGEKTAEAVACGAEHVLADCGVDVTLNKAMEIFEKNIRDHAEGDVGQLASEQTGTSEPGSVSSSSWRLAATYMLAEKGELPILADVAASLQRQNEPLSDPDKMILERIKDNLRRQLDCEVCFSLMLEPYTTACGHSFCRSCVARVLDHSNLCPICRRKLPQAAAVRSEPKNARLDSLILRFFPSAHQARLEAAGEDELNSLEDKLNNVPLFICTVSFPTIPTFLHVFEERYQLMLRRALQSGERRFGMVLPDMVPPGGRPFKQYGVMLEITRVERLPTGNSLVNTVGRYKFSVLQNAVLLDGYHTAKVERVDDISLTDEENMELREISSGRSGEEGLDSLPTQKLFEKLQLFVEQRRSEGVPWLHRRRLAAYGLPPSDPAVFPYWLASVLPIPESEKYALLPATSVRERLKIAARWVEKMEKKEWAIPDSPRRFLLLAAYIMLGFCILFLVLDYFFSLQSRSSGYFVSVSFLPLSVSFTYHSPDFPASRPLRSARTDSAADPSGEQYISKTLCLGVLAVLFLSRVIRRIGEVVTDPGFRRRWDMRRHGRQAAESGDALQGRNGGERDHNDAAIDQDGPANGRVEVSEPRIGAD